MATAKCLFAVEFAFDKPRACADHGHGCAELVYFPDCRGSLVQGGERLGYEPGDLLVYQPHLTHNDEMETPGVQFCVGVAGCDVEHLQPGVFRADDETRKAFEDIRTEVRRSHPLQSQRLDLRAGWLVLAIRTLQQQDETAPPEDNLPGPVSKLKEALDHRYPERLRISQLAGEIFIHPDYLRHLFRQSMGESPVGYLLRRRLESACELLAETPMSVQEIAEATGFGSPYYFCRFFKKQTGKTPTQYRKART